MITKNKRRIGFMGICITLSIVMSLSLMIATAIAQTTAEEHIQSVQTTDANAVDYQQHPEYNKPPVPDESTIAAEEAIRRAESILSDKFSDMEAVLPTAASEANHTYALDLTGTQPVWIVTFQNPAHDSGAYSVYMSKQGEVLYYAAPHVKPYAIDEKDVLETAKIVQPGEHDVSEQTAIQLAQNMIREISGYEKRMDKLEYKAAFLYHDRFNAGAEPVWLVDVFEDSALLQRVLLGYDGSYINTVAGNKMFERTERYFEDFAIDIRTLNFAAMSIEEKAAFTTQWKSVVDEYVKDNPYYAGRNTLMYQATRTVFGMPESNAMTKEKAVELAKEAAMNLGANKQNLDFSSIGYSYDVTDAGQPKWALVLRPQPQINSPEDLGKEDVRIFVIVLDAYSGEVLHASDSINLDTNLGFYR